MHGNKKKKVSMMRRAHPFLVAHMNHTMDVPRVAADDDGRTRDHMPTMPCLNSTFSDDTRMDMLWGRLNGIDEVIKMLQHGHNIISSSLDDLKGKVHQTVVDTPPPEC